MNKRERDRSTKTDQYYEENALDYASRTVSADMSKLHHIFLLGLPAGARILDAGCGSGRDLRVFIERGYKAYGIDASASLIEIARKYSGAECTVGRIEDINTIGAFDAIWACASLLHFPRSEISAVLQKLRKALVPGGLLFVSTMEGVGEKISPDGRFFAYYQIEDFVEVVRSAGFFVKNSWLTKDTLSRNSSNDWINILALA